MPVASFNSRPHEEADYPDSLGTVPQSTFNSRPHEEADSDRCPFSFCSGSFQLTASRGGRQSMHCLVLKIYPFNSRPHEEADHATLLPLQNPHSLSTHGLTRRPTEIRQFNGSIAGTFNSRPHEEADDGLPDGGSRKGGLSTHGLTRRPTLRYSASTLTRKLSTHGLTRRPTKLIQAGVDVGDLSTHGLTRRPTRIMLMDSSVDTPFNSRPHEEADYNFRTPTLGFEPLSTHGLTRRPTGNILGERYVEISFNSRPHEEADKHLTKQEYR